ncbi:M3 family oligoendopeptidase [Candidatus Acetothermia bacterium]|nr:M3 family oligoendopeptidase [Candidatus Acetothermia bacterium]MBI3643359.1 M3 family oligoendopeptidase [Candidatus Acetothermia bacterium]
MDWNWPKIEPYFQDLQTRSLEKRDLHNWMSDWSKLSLLIHESYARFQVGTTCNTTDKKLEERFNIFLENVYPMCDAADQQLKLKLLKSGLNPENFDVPLRQIRSESEFFREKNLPLFTQEKKLTSEYNKIIGAQTVKWDGLEVTITRLEPVSLDSDRAQREKAWRLASDRQLQDREKLNDLWIRFLNLREEIAKNADYSDYISYRWEYLSRFDYTPRNCKEFHASIEEVVVPAAKRILEKRKKQLGYTTLRPWDLNVDPLNHPSLKPFNTANELTSRSAAVFHKVNPKLGAYFDSMISDKVLDLENRKGKAPGGYCTTFASTGTPFIFMNSVGLQRDVRTMLHEAGHAFHAFEKLKLPYYKQHDVGAEFNEVASMAMELLASPYLTKEDGGFYSRTEAARARIQHLEGIVLFWPYMAVVDAFQHWGYENPKAALDAAKCDTTWNRLWDRFMPVTDWSGLEDAKVTGWHRKLHIFNYPFYYVEYGLAQLGAVQVWRNALKNQPRAVVDYCKALALGGTASLPKLYEAVGARFAFDSATLKEGISLLESEMKELEAQA